MALRYRIIVLYLNLGILMGGIQDPAVFQTAQRASMAQFIACQVHGVPVEELRKPTRGRPLVARARQIAIYLARIVFGMDRRTLAQQFRRDRSTVQHALEVIERLREDDAQFDSSLRWMEALLRRAAGMEA